MAISRQCSPEGTPDSHNVIDVPVDYDDRVYLVERHVRSVAELDGLAAEYAHHSQDLGQPAILATRASASDLADLIA